VFLGLYLEALDEELVTLQSSIGKHKPSSAPKVDELEEERDCTVRQLLYLCTEFGDADVQYTWTRIGRFGQVAHLAHIRWKVPLDRTRAKPA
jgi:hypothetical protein